jgi:hypothetical protein
MLSLARKSLPIRIWPFIIKVRYATSIWANSELLKYYTCSWRAAGGLVADIRNALRMAGTPSDSDAGKEDYMDFYISGGEGKVADWIASRLRSKGWEAMGAE